MLFVKSVGSNEFENDNQTERVIQKTLSVSCVWKYSASLCEKKEGARAKNSLTSLVHYTLRNDFTNNKHYKNVDNNKRRHFFKKYPLNPIK